MKPIGKIPSPYGPLLDVYYDRSRNLNEEDCYFHMVDDCMTLAGVHGKRNRAACAAEIKSLVPSQGISFDVFMRHGGRKMVYMPLPAPNEPVYPGLPVNTMDVPVEGWVTSAMDCANWIGRATVMLSVIEGNFENAKAFNMPDRLQVAGYSQLLTAALEHLHETEIDCIQSAAMYALTTHTEWSSAGVSWLEPIKATWFRDWCADQPTYRRMAKAMQWLNPTLPEWISGGAK